MDLKDLKNKKICVLGWGLENQSLVKFLLKKKIDSQITVCDARKSVETSRGLSLSWKLGKNYNKNLDKYDIIFRSPGYPLFEKNITKAKKTGVKISSSMKLFFDLCPTKNIIGVTGTKGKGTTVSLIYSILKKSFVIPAKAGIHRSGSPIRSRMAGEGKQVWLGGNIGVAPFSFINKIKKNDWVVLELSSFQLEDFEVSPKIAVLTNFYSEHLAPADPNNPNYHQSLKKYWEAKTNIFKWQKKGDYLISNFQFPIFKQFPISNFQTKSKKIYFKKSDLPSKLVGEHNKENIAAAIEVAKIIGIKKDITKKAVANFKGLEHRIELAKKINGIRYYDDSFATTPESTIIALESFSSPIIVLLGGADKGSDFSRLAKTVKQKVKFVVLLTGIATPRIKKTLIKIGYPKGKMKLVNNIKEAMKQINQKSVNGDIVLLSTACASFGMFKNYKERGNLFKKEVESIK